MFTYQRIKRLLSLKSHSKKGPLLSQTCKSPQYSGTPGWLLLSHDTDMKPTALFVDMRETVSSVPLVLDERLFSDSVFRVTRLRSDMFVVSDIRILNGKNVFETLAYTQRQALLNELLDTFHYPDLTALVSLPHVPDGYPIRGYEHYDEQPGTVGVFLPAVE
jgi:hypothetical protein